MPVIGCFRTLGVGDLSKAVVPMVKTCHTCLCSTIRSITYLRERVILHLNIMESPSIALIRAPVLIKAIDSTQYILKLIKNLYYTGTKTNH